ncbi:MAG: hypothetical protein ACREIW_14400, partial [Chthoniobacterales bacterium]
MQFQCVMRVAQTLVRVFARRIRFEKQVSIASHQRSENKHVRDRIKHDTELAAEKPQSLAFELKPADHRWHKRRD